MPDSPKITTAPLTTKHVIIRIAIIIAVFELFIMLMLRLIPHESGTYSEAAFDTLLLTILSTPAIYIWVIKPFVSARDNALAQINHLAYTDPLTQLANRRFVSKHLGKIISNSIRHKNYGAVLLIDLDEFKPVNDNHGHDAGDAILVEIATRLQSNVRSEDVVGRLGGDEFIVLIHHLGSDEQIAHNASLQIAEKLINIINKPFNFCGKSLQLSASIGIHLLGFERLDTETAINKADAAMYRAKKAGKGCATFFKK